MSKPYHGTLAGVIEIAMNRVIQLDPESLEKLQGIAGRVIAIELTDWQMQLFFLPDEYRFSILTSLNNKPDVKLRGKSHDFFRMGVNKHFLDSSRVLETNIHYEGDVVTGQKFEQLFGELKINWEDVLADVVDESFAHNVSRVVHHAGNLLKDIFGVTEDNAGDCLKKELIKAPSKAEFQSFSSELDKLTSDTQQLMTRFERIKQQLQKKDDPQQ